MAQTRQLGKLGRCGCVNLLWGCIVLFFQWTVAVMCFREQCPQWNRLTDDSWSWCGTESVWWEPLVLFSGVNMATYCVVDGLSLRKIPLSAPLPKPEWESMRDPCRTNLGKVCGDWQPRGITLDFYSPAIAAPFILPVAFILSVPLPTLTANARSPLESLLLPFHRGTPRSSTPPNTPTNPT